MSDTQTVRAKAPLPREFFVSLLATLFFALSMTLIIPLVPLYITDELGEAEHWIGTATLMIALAAVSTRIPGGALSDTQGRRKLMLVGAAFSVMAGVLYVFSNGLWLFLAARLLNGVGLGLFTTAAKALAADLTPASRRGEAMGYTNAAFSVASVASPLLSEGLKNAISFQAVFALSALLALLAFAITLTLPATLPARAVGQTVRGDLGIVLRVRGLWAATLLMMALAPIMSVMFTFFPLLAERKELLADSPRLLSSIAIGIGLSLWSLVDTVIEPIAGRISDRVGRLVVGLPGLVIAVLGVLALARATNTATTFAAIAFTSAGWGMARATSDSMVQDAVPPALRGMGAAILYTGFDLAVGGGAQALGTVINGSDFSAFFRLTLVMVGVLALFGLALSLRLKSHDPQSAGLPQIAHPAD